MIFIEELNACADNHEAAGGTTKTITINGTAVRCCLDENGKYESALLKAMAYVTRQ